VSDTLEPAAAGPMQVRPEVANLEPAPRWQNAPAAAASSTIPAGVMALLEERTWVHKLGLSRECEGCANDGEPGYCRGAAPGWEQQDVRSAEEVEAGEAPAILCHCGHAVVPLELTYRCGCYGPGSWHCAGEEAQHWAKGEELDAECGHCGDEGYQLEAGK
jgi:hypothetical protein